MQWLTAIRTIKAANHRMERKWTGEMGKVGRGSSWPLGRHLWLFRGTQKSSDREQYVYLPALRNGGPSATRMLGMRDKHFPILPNLTQLECLKYQGHQISLYCRELKPHTPQLFNVLSWGGGESATFLVAMEINPFPDLDCLWKYWHAFLPLQGLFGSFWGMNQISVAALVTFRKPFPAAATA